MTRLADLVPFRTITSGRLLESLEEARPDLMAWSRSDGAASLPPPKLASLILEALPGAFAATMQEAARGEGLDQVLINKPFIEILDPAGVVQWTLGFKLELTPGLSGQRIRDFSLAVIGTNGQPVILIVQSLSDP